VDFRIDDCRLLIEKPVFTAEAQSTQRDNKFSFLLTPGGIGFAFHRAGTAERKKLIP